jgi:hypothetical protein
MLLVEQCAGQSHCIEPMQNLKRIKQPPHICMHALKPTLNNGCAGGVHCMFCCLPNFLHTQDDGRLPLLHQYKDVVLTAVCCFIQSRCHTASPLSNSPRMNQSDKYRNTGRQNTTTSIVNHDQCTQLLIDQPAQYPYELVAHPQDSFGGGLPSPV